MMPLYEPGNDPGPDVVSVLRQNGAPILADDLPTASDSLDITHGTTCVALRIANGVIMAGDRRATSGNMISRRDMQKVFPADRHSGVAIAGAAGPAIEMVKLFQLQLEHYEKVEGKQLSLEGKANQLSGMVRNHLPMAMQGLTVVPIFAGWDVRRSVGRLYEYDVTGGRYEETSFAATGSGSLYANTVIKLGFVDELTREDGIDLALTALFQAADEDSATGGPDLVRGIYPVVATITDDGYDRVEEDELAARWATLADKLSPVTGAKSADVT